MTNNRAVIRVTKHGKDEYFVALCPMGHLLTSQKLGRDFAGGWLEAEWGKHSHGQPNAFDRMAERCKGAGHGTDEPAFVAACMAEIRRLEVARTTKDAD